jgi:hypothetical protein
MARTRAAASSLTARYGVGVPTATFAWRPAGCLAGCGKEPLPVNYPVHVRGDEEKCGRSVRASTASMCRLLVEAWRSAPQDRPFLICLRCSFPLRRLHPKQRASRLSVPECGRIADQHGPPPWPATRGGIRELLGSPGGYNSKPLRCLAVNRCDGRTLDHHPARPHRPLPGRR